MAETKRVLGQVGNKTRISDEVFPSWEVKADYLMVGGN